MLGFTSGSGEAVEGSATYMYVWPLDPRQRSLMSPMMWSQQQLRVV